MQRSKIKVGETYGVVARATKRAEAHGPATVVAIDGEYRSWRSTGFSGRYETKRDGIVVTFDHDVIRSYDVFKSVADLKERNPGYRVNKVDVIRAGTEVVLPGARCVVGEWAPIAEMRARWARERDERKVKIDAVGDTVEPVYEAVFYALAVKSESGDPNDVCKIKAHTQEGTEKRRTIDATFTFELDDLATLLGVAVKPEGGE